MTHWLSYRVVHLRLDDCEGDQEFFQELSALLRLSVTEIADIFSWVNDPPYLFAHADEPAVAQAYLTALEDLVLEEQHPVVVYHMHTFGEKLRAIAGGDRSAADVAFMAERDIWRRMAITSDPAEGYHRSVMVTHKHAPAAKLPFLLASNRLAQNLINAKQWCKHDDMLAQFSFNFKKLPRVLQTSRRARLRPVRQLMKHTFATAYRLSEYAREDWSGLVGPVVGPEAPAGSAPRSSEFRLQIEWPNATFREGEFLSLKTEQAGHEQIIQVLRKSSGTRKRVRTLRSVVSHHAAQLSIVLQNWHSWGPRDGVEFEVFPAGESYEMEAMRLAPPHELIYNMFVWKNKVSDVEGCFTLYDRCKAEPVVLNEEDRPTLCYMLALIDAGWKPTADKVTHERDSPLVFSTRDAASKKNYYKRVAMLDGLFARGIVNLPSDAVQ